MNRSRLVAAVAVFALAGAAWPTFGGAPARPGNVAGDRALSPATVPRLRRRWIAGLERTSDATPIVLDGVVAGGRARTMLYITDKSGTTYGIDANDGTVRWRFRTSGPKITTSVPVASEDRRHVYAGGVDGRVHELAAATGEEERGRGFPVVITRMPDVEKNASALNLANGFLYAVTSGYIGDAGPYVGHVVTVRLSDGATRVFNSLCSRERTLLLDRAYDPQSAHACDRYRSGIWSRAGAVVDPDPALRGHVYVATGNGPFDADRGGDDYGDAVLALSADGSTLVDWYVPGNYAELESEDADLGSSAPALLPREPKSATPLLAVEGGKDAVLHLLDRTHLGHARGALQNEVLPERLFTAPAVWGDGAGRTWIFLGFAPGSTGVTAFRVVTRAGKTRLERAWTASARGTSPVVENGVVFAAADGAVRALDAGSGRVLWSSSATAAGGGIGDVHWQSPVVAGDRLYIADQDAHVTAYAPEGSP